MTPIDHRRVIATGLIHAAAAKLANAELKDLSTSEKKIVAGGLKKLATIASSLTRTNPLSNDDAAAKLAAVAATLMNCTDSELKRIANTELTQAAKIFDELSQGL
jgi:hypothetical protein